MGAKVLIAGKSGQLATEMLRLAPAGYSCTALGRNQIDLADARTVAQACSELRPDWIINCAAYTAVDRAETESEAAYQLNRDAVRNLAQAAQGCGARILHVSTDFVFDGRKSSPYLPGDATNPLGVYGASKLAGEAALREVLGDRALVVRTGWVYAAHGGNFVKTILRLLREKPELRVISDQVGTPTSAASLAGALWKLAASDAPGATHHYSDAGVASWYDLACATREFAQRQSGATLPPIHPIRADEYPLPAVRPAYSVLDKTSAWNITGKSVHWREALAPVVAALLQA